MLPALAQQTWNIAMSTASLSDHAVGAAKMISANHTGVAAIDTADGDECAFIFAAVALVMSDTCIAMRIGELMEQPEIRNAVWPGEEGLEEEE
jgi:hypothetical protein